MKEELSRLLQENSVHPIEKEKFEKTRLEKEVSVKAVIVSPVDMVKAVVLLEME